MQAVHSDNQQYSRLQWGMNGPGHCACAHYLSSPLSWDLEMGGVISLCNLKCKLGFVWCVYSKPLPISKSPNLIVAEQGGGFKTSDYSETGTKRVS